MEEYIDSYLSKEYCTKVSVTNQPEFGVCFLIFLFGLITNKIKKKLKKGVIYVSFSNLYESNFDIFSFSLSKTYFDEYFNLYFMDFNEHLHSPTNLEFYKSNKLRQG